MKMKVFLIAKTVIEPIEGWLMHLGAHEFMAEGADGDALAEVAGRRCYNSFKPGLNPNVTKVRKEGFLKNILKQGHGSVLEHVTGTFAFEGVSRVFTHELVRHRAGCAYSQESLRYVRLDESLKVEIPDCIKENPQAKELFKEAIRINRLDQLKLSNIFDIDKLSFEEKKELTSAFRRIAPMGLSTAIVATFNMRALRHIIAMRTSPGAEQEIRKVFLEVFKIAVKEWPLIFQDSIEYKGEVTFENEKV